MSSFFTLPASQKKRKRPEAPGNAPDKSAKPARRKQTRDESISGSDISDDDAPDDVVYPMRVHLPPSAEDGAGGAVTITKDAIQKHRKARGRSRM